MLFHFLLKSSSLILTAAFFSIVSPIGIMLLVLFSFKQVFMKCAWDLIHTFFSLREYILKPKSLTCATLSPRMLPESVVFLASVLSLGPLVLLGRVFAVIRLRSLFRCISNKAC